MLSILKSKKKVSGRRLSYLQSEVGVGCGLLELISDELTSSDSHREQLCAPESSRR